MIDSKLIFKFTAGLVFFSLFFSCAMRRTLQDQGLDSDATVKRHVMVLPFLNRTNEARGRLEEEFSKDLQTLLNQSGRYVLVDADQADTTKELKNLSPFKQGQINPWVAQRFWKFLGIHVFLYGEILSYEKQENPASHSLQVNLILVSARDGAVTWKKTLKGTGMQVSQDLTSLVHLALDSGKQEIFEVIDQVAWSTRVLQIQEPGKIYIQGGRRSGLTLGETLVVLANPQIKSDSGFQDPLKSYTQKGKIRLSGFVGTDQSICTSLNGLAILPDDLVVYPE